MKWAERVRDIFIGDPSHKDIVEEVVGTPLPPGTEMIECSFCHCAVPTVAFYEHGRYHQKVMHVERGDDE